MSTPVKIIKFGVITEDESGDLVMEGFHIDVGGQYFDSAKEVILTAVIERLQQELKEVSK